MVRTVVVLVAGLLIVGCSGGGPEVESGPRGRASGIPAPEAASSGEVRTSTAATLGIPPGHLPPPGQCRIWRPGTPPGHQEKPGSCAVLERRVPAGAWLVYRPSKNRKEVRVSVYDSASPRVSLIRVFDAVTGRLLSEMVPDRR